MILWSLSKQSRSLSAFSEHSYFAVHILAASPDFRWRSRGL
jgi:flavin reductase (DIM6/NTAB) family NADH-FMN oxidoreductase RutF